MNKKLNLIAAASLMALGMGVAQAGETIELGDGLKFDWRLNVNYTLAMRTKDASPKLVSQGNSNFDKHDLTANRLATMFESKLHKGSSGLVFTASTFYDDVYHDSKFNNRAQRMHGGYTRLLDTYAYTSFNMGESRATVRAGRHVVNWGESTYFANIAAAQGPFDASKSSVPGTEIKESVLPEDQISASIEVTPRLSLLGHYQFGYHETVLNAVGAYQSTTDLVGPGSKPAKYIRPSDAGQWGIGTRYRVTNETEVGLYYLNYNDRSPSVQFAPDFRSYNIRFFDDIKMLAGTVSTTFGPVTAYSEYSYRKGTPVGVGARSTPTRANQSQLNVGGMYNIGRTSLADDMVLLGEFAATRVHSVESGDVNDLGFKTRNSLAFSGTLSMSYPGIAEGWDLTVPIGYMRQIKGRSNVGSFGGGQGDHRLSVGATFVYKSNLALGISYIDFLGSPSTDSRYNRSMTDRDQLSITAKYSF